MARMDFEGRVGTRVDGGEPTRPRRKDPPVFHHGVRGLARCASGAIAATLVGIAMPAPALASTFCEERLASSLGDAATPKSQMSDFGADIEMRKRYGNAALEIVTFDVLLNQANRHWSGNSDYDNNLSTIRRNLRSHWGVDSDPFNINQLAHPYQGSVYHTLARSSGLNYWESAAYTFGGSIFWEIAGEKTRPSANDQVASGIGGSFLGEALFRMANLLLENGKGKGTADRYVREAGAALIAPGAGFNRLASCYQDPLFRSNGAEYYSRVQVGLSRSSEDDAGLSTTALKRHEAVAEFAIDYGLPGKNGYEYRVPFDYFALQAATSSANGFENVLVRGSLFARPYERLDRKYRGIWGLFGTYDYIAPQTFRVSSTGLSLGTVGQWNASDLISMQGSALFGVGYAAVGTVRSSDERDYQYGIAPQGLLGFRMVYAERLSLDLTGREYFVSRVAAAARGGHENISRLDASLTWRISEKKPHAVSIKYLGNRRDVSYPDIGSRKQTRATVGLYYTYLGHDAFATERW